MRLLVYAFLISCFCAEALYSQQPQMVDMFGRISCDDYLARMQAEMTFLQKTPSSKIYFMMYEGPSEIFVGKSFTKRMANPVYGSFNAKVHSMKRYLSMNHQDLNNFVFVDGGFREFPTVEVWLVPNGIEPPKPIPTVKMMKLRRGKARGFCTDCCGT